MSHAAQKQSFNDDRFGAGRLTYHAGQTSRSVRQWEASMKIVFDDGDIDYEEYQALMVEELVSSLRGTLERAGISGQRLHDLVAEIASDVGCLFDGSTPVSTEDDDGHLVPILGFAQGRMRDRLLLSGQGGGSSLHEFVSGIVEDEFSEGSAR